LIGIKKKPRHTQEKITMEGIRRRLSIALSDRSSVATGSGRSSRVLDRVDIYSLEYHGNSRRARARVTLGDEIYQDTSTSMSSAVKNPVSRMVLCYQALCNLSAFMKQHQGNLRVTGDMMRDSGALYDEEFPSTLREWIVKNPLIRDEKGQREAIPEYDKRMLNALIIQLITISSFL